MSENKIPYKIYLEENEMPQAWYNVRADMKNKPAPLLNPGTLQPMTAEELGGVFCQELVKQAAEKTHEFYVTASAKVQEVASGVAPAVVSAAESDELRQKIEAARQRIAAQVIKNAEDAQLVDVEAEAVQAVAEEEPAVEEAE